MGCINMKLPQGSNLDKRIWLMAWFFKFCYVSKNVFWSVKYSWVTWQKWWQHYDMTWYKWWHHLGQVHFRGKFQLHTFPTENHLLMMVDDASWNCWLALKFVFSIIFCIEIFFLYFVLPTYLHINNTFPVAFPLNNYCKTFSNLN